ncbi:hypothetical protein [Thalassoroseus pseudoceratinae]|uniref:hypothetical protein n=1 Tax=Thalassoroseus pseudoceratinae TaxID=2713176 RepID=UPI00141E63C1|nr:hypothetical protein [Thalassoroseus pseudoceratinae]
MYRPRKPTRSPRRTLRVRGKVRTFSLGPWANPATQAIVQAESVSEAMAEAARASAESVLTRLEQLEPCQRFLDYKTKRLLSRVRRKRQLSGVVALLDSSVHPTTDETPMFRHQTRQRSAHLPKIDRDDWDELLERVTDGNADALAELQQRLRRHPQLRDLLGDVSRYVQEVLIDMIGSESVLVRESLLQRHAELREQLQVIGTDPLERLLIEQTLTTLLDLSIQQMGFFKRAVTENQKRRWERNMERAQKHHLATIARLNEYRHMSNQNRTP